MRAIVQIYTVAGGRMEAVDSTEHPASSHGLPVLLVGGEPVGPADLLGSVGGVDVLAAVVIPDDAPAELAVALQRAGYPVVSAEAPPR
jgi:hypothetical protein